VKTTLIQVEPLAALQIQAAAAEVYPKESGAVLLGKQTGDTTLVVAIHPYQTAKKRTRFELTTETEADLTMLDWFKHKLIGDWHSHPEALPAATETDKEEWLENYCDGSVAIVSSIWPTKKSPGFTFRHKAYCTHLGKVYTARLLFL